MDDICLIERLAGGEMCYFDTLVTLYHKRIYDFIYRMVHNISTAEDITQDVFIKVYQNIHKLNSNSSLKPWIFKIAYTTTLNYLKKNKNIAIDLEVEELPWNKDCIDAFETRHVVLKEIQSLKSDCKAIFLLRVMEDLTFEQIGLMLGASTASVKLKFYRNRKTLIDRLSQSFREV